MMDLRRFPGAWISFIALCHLSRQVSGHGYLNNPPSRSVAWKYGFPVPVNYDYNGLNCGGFYRQWNQNGGKCGVCGDPWDTEAPRPNEVGGIYGKGIIVRNYTSGQEVVMQIVITAQHKGWFEFRLCPNEEESENNPTTQDCLDNNLLTVIDNGSQRSTRYHMPANASVDTFNITLILPDEVTSSHCVLQWKWHAGNSWGVGQDGVGCIGCGPQEEFINCADIAILPSSTNPKPITPLNKTTENYSPSSAADRPSSSPQIITGPTSTPNKTEAVCKAIGMHQDDVLMDAWCTENCAVNNCPATHCQCYRDGQRVTPAPDSPDFTKCKSHGVWKGPIMDRWCVSNCAAGYCPRDYCDCS